MRLIWLMVLSGLVAVPGGTIASWDDAETATAIGKSPDDCRKQFGKELPKPVPVPNMSDQVRDFISFQGKEWIVTVGFADKKAVVVVYTKPVNEETVQSTGFTDDEIAVIRKRNSNGRLWVDVGTENLWMRTDKNVAVLHDPPNRRVIVITGKWLDPGF